MRLRFSTTLIMGAVLAVSSLAHAKSNSTPAPAKAPNPSSSSGLAQVEAIFSYCESVDPLSAAKYRKVQSHVLSGYSDSDDKNSAFRSEFSAFSAQLATIPKSTGVATCRIAIVGN
jgi:hypothetical protein